MTMKEYMQVGERALDLTRAFNARKGLTRKDDLLPKRLMEPLPDGRSPGNPSRKRFWIVCLTTTTN
jgi:aldehyde:ferredoxin oxidoreductase